MLPTAPWGAGRTLGLPKEMTGMSRRKRLIERQDEAATQGAFPAMAQAFNLGGYVDPVNYVAAATPPEGVQNPNHTPEYPAEGYGEEGQA